MSIDQSLNFEMESDISADEIYLIWCVKRHYERGRMMAMPICYDPDPRPQDLTILGVDVVRK